jgi:hypothetical protein
VITILAIVIGSVLVKIGWVWTKRRHKK